MRRTRALLHCISLEDESIKDAYKTVRAELKSYAPELADKKEVIILTKTDMVDEKTLKKKVKEAKKLSEHVFTVSILDDVAVKALADNLIKILG